jgi:beta-glucosidase
VLGLQGAGLVATAKHFLGDGGTGHGKDQGVTRASVAELVNLHTPGYFGALGAGVQGVMVVSRILRVKLRAGLFEASKPSRRAGAGQAGLLQHRELARQAVRKSLVLLKNNGGVLPLARGQRILVVGASADSMPNQSGGWSVTWQGHETTNADFPNGTTLLAAIRRTAGDALVRYDTSARGVDVKAFDAVIAVLGERPYAEGRGDIEPAQAIAHAFHHEGDAAVLKRVSGHGVPVVTVLLSGRPLYVNPQINRSDAFVAAWLPGTEGQGVADLLFRAVDGSVVADFTGRLPYSWPKDPCQSRVNMGDAETPLFPYGFGLTVAERRELPPLPEPAVARCDERP